MEIHISAIARFIMGFKHQVDVRRGPIHRHDGLEIVYHALGSGSVRLQSGNEISFDSNSVVIHASGIIHEQLNTEPGEDWCIVLDISSVPNLSDIPESIVLHSMTSPYLRHELSRLADTKVITPPELPDAHDLRATALLLDLLNLIRQEHSARGDISVERRVELAHEYIRVNFDQIRSMGEVANYVHLSPDYLRHRFRETYGCSMKKLLIQTRLGYAKHLLNHTPLLQKAIAAQCGFDNVRYFNTSFKHYVGITPGKYRRSTVSKESGFRMEEMRETG